MTDGSDHSVEARRTQDGGAANSLAAQALSVLASRRAAPEAAVEQALAARLESAVLALDPDQRDRALAEIRAAGIGDSVIHDAYVPAVARRLGERWTADQIGFADTSIGTARLQSMLRCLEGRDDPYRPVPSALVAVVVPPAETHTLGALVLAGQLRRAGVAVRPLLGLGDGNLLDAIENDSFDAIFLSVTYGRMLVNLGKLVKKIRGAAGAGTPIVVGGSAVVKRDEAKRLTRADHVTKDLAEAMRLCGLKISMPAAGRPESPMARATAPPAGLEARV